MTMDLATIPPQLREFAARKETPLKPIPQEDWAAMPAAERIEALMLYSSEIARNLTDIIHEFPKIKVPTGAQLYWTVPGKEEPVKEVHAVVIGHYRARGYWPAGQPVSNNPPECSSLDGKVPEGGRGPKGHKSCAECPYDQYGSGKEGRGKACKEMINTYLSLEGQGVPTLLSIPPTSMKAFSRYATSLANDKKPLAGTVTVFTLAKKQGKSAEYSVLELREGRALSFKELKDCIATRNQFEAAMSKRGVTEADADIIEADQGYGGPARSDEDVPF